MMVKKRNEPILKEQEAIEYLMTYGWALLLIAVGFLSVVFVSNTVFFVSGQSGCIFVSKVQCLIRNDGTSTVSPYNSTASTTINATSITSSVSTISTVTSTSIITSTSVNTTTVPANVTTTINIGTGGKIYGINAAPDNGTANIFATKQGVKYLRYGLAFTSAQESYIAQESSLGVSVLGIGFPLILSNGSVCLATGPACNWTLAQWNASVAPTVLAYPGITAWEIDNEPESHLSGFNNGSAYNYYLMIKGAATVIRSIDPGATIVCFGGAAIGTTELAWYQQVWSYGASQYCNVISIHAYANQGTWSNNTASVWGTSLLDYESFTGKPIWITETGTQYTGSGYSQAGQALFLNRSFSFLSNQTYVQRIYWYNLYGSTFSLMSGGNQTFPGWNVFLAYTKT